MLRSTRSRRFLGLTVAVAAGAGIGLGTLGVLSAAGAQTPLLPHTSPAAASRSATLPPGQPAPPTPVPASPVTADRAAAIATSSFPGTVVEVEQDDESTGAVFEVTVRQSDGTDTTVEVDAGTGHVVSTETDPADANDPRDAQ
jgi:hypothetical protein